MILIFRTNLPKEVMQFKDVPFRDELPSFLTHEDVLEYLQEFSRGIPVQFNQTVENVERSDDKWKVRKKKRGKARKRRV